MEKTTDKPIIRPVLTQEDISALARLAGEIWHECFAHILSGEQIDYMLQRFQSAEALAGQREQGYEYRFVCRDKTPLGYFGILPQPDGRLFLSKLYLLSRARGTGIASFVMDYLEDLCRRRGLNVIHLTVNRHNDRAIRVYRHWGFRVVEEKVADIGRGFVMDDFIMQKDLPPR